MIFRKFSKAYVINETVDGCYLSDGHGFVMEAEEAIELAHDLIRFAKKHACLLADSNIEQNKYYEELQKGHYSNGQSKKTKNKSSVYMFKCNDTFKIGVSKDVKRRMRELNNRPYPIELVSVSVPMTCAYEVEKEIHEYLEGYRLDG